jgi:hypothetical protein
MSKYTKEVLEEIAEAIYEYTDRSEGTLTVESVDEPMAYIIVETDGERFKLTAEKI